MTIDLKDRCTEQVSSGEYTFTQCSYRAVEGNKCKRHALSTREAKDKALRAKWAREKALRDARSTIEQIEREIVKAVITVRGMESRVIFELEQLRDRHIAARAVMDQCLI